MFFAVASGACAAFNGVFAKLYVIPLFSLSSPSIYIYIYLSLHLQFTYQRN